MINIHYEDENGKKDFVECKVIDRELVCKYLLKNGYYLIGEY